MFRQGKKPALVVPFTRLDDLRVVLRRADYHPHTGHRYQRDGELEAWSSDLPANRHVHVQFVSRDRDVAVYAHTEPARGLAHVLSAVTDRANYAAGARKLRADLRRHGWRARG